MNRLRHLPSSLAWTIAVIIAWTERQDPVRSSVNAAASGTPGESTRAAALSAQPAHPGPPSAENETSPVPADRVSKESSNQTLIAPSATSSLPRRPDDRKQTPVTAAPAAAPPASTALKSSTTPGSKPDAANKPTTPSPSAPAARPAPALRGAVAGDGSRDCPANFPIKGNASSMIYHRPGQSSYDRTIPEFCFASETDAEAAGYRAPRH
jgi:hypothetical protein